MEMSMIDTPAMGNTVAAANNAVLEEKISAKESLETR
jgi:hypothetical protein